MNANWQRYGELLVIFERVLTLMGIWPSKQIPAIRVVIVAILSGFCVMFVIKMFTHPERESIENGLALCLGALMMVLLFARITLNEEKMEDVLDFIKEDLKQTPSEIAKETLSDIDKDIQLILIFVKLVFPMSVILKVIMPFLQFGYAIIIRDENASIPLPPAMALPSFSQLGIYGDITVYLLECIVRMIMLFWLLGGAILFVVSSLYIGGAFLTLAREFETISIGDVQVFDTFIQRHELIASKALILTRLYSTHFFVDSAVSYINLAVLLLSMFSSHRGLDSFVNDLLLTTAGGSQYGMIVIYGGHIMECSLQVYKGAYNSEWIGTPITQQKKLIFLLQRSQKATSLSVYQNFTASIEFLADMIRNSYAAFNLLRNTIH